VILAYSTFSVTIRVFIRARFVAASVGVSAGVPLLSLVVWAHLLAILGALLAMPMAPPVRDFFRDADERAALVRAADRHYRGR
jgi:predicted PurR-regulated permease PerM